MSDLYDSYRAQRHFSCLDGIRFISIMAVIWHHTPGARDYHAMTELFGRGHVGVDFFFVLSGYLITTLLLREEATTGRFSLRGFYWRRALRIIPLYFLVVTVAAFNDIILNGETDKLAILPYYYLFLANFIAVEDITFLDPTWSLSVEEQYYLVWPLLLLLLPRRWIVPALIGLIAVNIGSAMGLFAYVGITGFAMGPLYLAISGATYAPILMGSLAAVILHNRAGFGRLAAWLAPRAAPWICLGALMAALALLPARLEGWPNLIMHTLMTLTLISVVVREDNGMGWLLCARPIVRIGQISYGLYLYHSFARGVTTPVLYSWGWDSVWLVLIAYFALSVVIAEISFRTYEAWFLRLRYKTKRSTAAQ